MAELTRTQGRRGRPSTAEAALKQEVVLASALDIFLQRGFESTTMEDIARAANVSKRTLYSRYADKNAIFLAAVERAAESYTVSRESLRAIETDDLEDTLLALARLRLANLSSAEGMRLQRILAAESFRFPRLQTLAFESSTAPTVDFLAGLFERHTLAGRLSVTDPRRAAIAFLSLVLGAPARRITSGNPPGATELEEGIRFAVGLFLRGVLPRQDRSRRQATDEGDSTTLALHR